MGELTKLPNIGAAIERQLIEAGINNFEQLKQEGSRQAWLKIKAMDPSACLNRLYCLEGAIQCVKKTMLPQETRAALKEFYNLHK